MNTQTLAIVLTLSLSACQSKEVQSCRDRYLASHAVVSEVDTNDFESVDAALKAVNETLAICEQAQLQEEITQLKTAQRKLESHHGYLSQRQARRELSPDELAKFVTGGDPRCPKGQSYMYKKSGQKLRCVGPQVVQMAYGEAKEYFAGRGFKITDSDAKLVAEFGSESYRYSFAKRDDTQPASCLVVFSQPGIAWQETAARVSGVAVRRIKEGVPLAVAGRQIALRVTGDETQAVLAFGECPEKL